jgi:DNA-binding NarL/FixJ family response regulator
MDIHPHERLLQILSTMLMEINVLQAQILPVAYANTTVDGHTGSMDLSRPGDTSPLHIGMQTLEQLTREALSILHTLQEEQAPASLEELTLAPVFSRLVEEATKYRDIASPFSGVDEQGQPDERVQNLSPRAKRLFLLLIREVLYSIEKRQDVHVAFNYGEDQLQLNAETIGILIVDGQAVSRAGLHHLLESYTGLRIVGEAADGVQAVSETLELGPQVVLMDAHLPEGQSLEALRQIKQLNLGTKLLLLAAQDREEALYETLRVGADGYILKDITPDELVQAIRRVARGEVFIQPQIASRLISRLRTGESPVPTDKLTNRELEVLQLLARGMRNKEMATKLSVSERTINFHLTNIYQKLQVSGRTEALSKALEQRLIASPWGQGLSPSESRSRG